MAFKDIVNPLLLTIALAMWIVTAVAPFASLKGDALLSITISLFHYCSTTNTIYGSSSSCETVTISTSDSFFGCTSFKNLWIGAQAMVMLSILVTSFPTFLSYARLGGLKCVERFNGKILVVFHTLMIIFGITCACLVGLIYNKNQCGSGNAFSDMTTEDVAFYTGIVGAASVVTASIFSANY